MIINLPIKQENFFKIIIPIIIFVGCIGFTMAVIQDDNSTFLVFGLYSLLTLGGGVFILAMKQEKYGWRFLSRLPKVELKVKFNE